MFIRLSVDVAYDLFTVLHTKMDPDNLKCTHEPTLSVERVTNARLGELKVGFWEVRGRSLCLSGCL